MRLLGRKQALPQVDVLHRLLACGLPTALDPPLHPVLVKAFTTYCESDTTRTSHGRRSASRPAMTRVAPCGCWWCARILAIARAREACPWCRCSASRCHSRPAGVPASRAVAVQGHAHHGHRSVLSPLSETAGPPRAGSRANESGWRHLAQVKTLANERPPACPPASARQNDRPRPDVLQVCTRVLMVGPRKIRGEEALS